MVTGARMYRGNQRCLLVGYVTHQLISSPVVDVGSLIDGNQPLALEDEFRRIMKIAVRQFSILVL